MKKETAKKILLTFFTVYFSILFFVLVAAQSDSPITDKLKTLTNSGGDLFNTLFGKTLTGGPIWELAVTKFLLMLLIFSIVYGVADIFITAKGKMQTALTIIFSAVVAYLSVIYLAPAEIYAALVGWGAMAIAITAIVPFAVIMALSWKLASNPNPGKIFVQKILLAVFAVYLFVRLIVLWAYNPDAWVLALPIYGVIFLVTIIMLIFNKTIQRFILSTKVSGYLQISDALNKEEALANAIMLRDKANALERVGATAEATELREAATRLETVAKKKFS